MSETVSVPELAERTVMDGNAGTSGGHDADMEPTAVTVVSGEPAVGANSQDATEASVGAATHWSVAPSSPLEALRLEEIERTRAFILAVYWMSLVIPPVLFFVGGSTNMKFVLVGFIVVNLVSLVRLHTRLREPGEDLATPIAVAASIAAITTFTGVIIWGVFSVAPAIMVVGIYFFSRSESKAAALAIYLICAVMQFVTAMLFIFDILPDPAMFPRTGTMTDQLIAQALVQGIYLTAFFIGRSTRTSSLGTIEKLQTAINQLSNRDVLLQEARQELEQALRVEGAGRYTGQLVGPWKLNSVLGRGGMGEVYEGVHKDSDQWGAVKVLHPEVMQQPEHLARFLREARAASTLLSRHVVRVIDVSERDAELPYIAMERLTGADLSHELRHKTLTIREVQKLVDEVGAVLDLAREKGIVHRDIKPQNLLLSGGVDGHPIWKVLDFGVSKLDESSGTLTQGHIVGTPTYMAPEQAQGHEVDAQADLYSLAAVAYRCLTGRPPFSGKEMAVTIFKVVGEMPPCPSAFAELHSDVDLVMAIGMCKTPSLRFSKAAEFADALRLATRGELDSETRSRAEAILARTPWNRSV